MKINQNDIFEQSLDIINSQLNTKRTNDIDTKNNNTNNNLKKYKYTSSDSLISSFSFFSILSINNEDYEVEENELYESQLCNCNNLNKIYLIRAFWCYHMITQHNLIELNLKCQNCNSKFIIVFHKNSKGKEKLLIDEHLKITFVIKWVKRPKNQINFIELLKYYDEATNDWSLLFNNCYHFAKSIWNKLD